MKKLSDIESSILQFLDGHIRFIQYSCYAVGLVGIAAIIKSTRTLTHFSSPREIPNEFISKSIKLQGRVVNIQTLPVPSSASIYNGETLFSLRLQIDHIPILNLKWMTRGKQPAATLPVELAGVWCASKGAQLVQQLTLNKDVWFTIYGINQDRTVLYSSVMLKKSWKLWQQRDVGISLLKEQQGFVAAWPHDFTLNDIYPKYYRKLLHYEAKFKNRASGLIEKLSKYFFK